MRLQRAMGKFSLPGSACYATCEAVSRRLDYPLSLRERVRVRGPRALWGFGDGCNHGIVCWHAVARKHCPEKERAYALCQLPP
jgi:hypothetical protein